MTNGKYSDNGIETGLKLGEDLPRYALKEDSQVRRAEEYSELSMKILQLQHKHNACIIPASRCDPILRIGQAQLQSAQLQ